MGQEKTFENKVKSYLNSLGAYFVKYWGGMFTTAGVPDLLVCYKGRFIGIEVKSMNGKPSKLQLYNKRQIERAGGICIILYPNQFNEFKKFMENIKEAGDRIINVSLEGVDTRWLKD